MHQVEQHSTRRAPSRHPETNFSEGPEMLLYTRYEHGNMPVHVYRDGGQTVYEVTMPSEACRSGRRVEHFATARALMRSIYGRDVHMPFDRYFRLGRYRQAGRASGQADLLTLLELGVASTRRTDVVVHHTKTAVEPAKKTSVVYAGKRTPLPTSGVEGLRGSGGVFSTQDSGIEAFVEAMERDLLPCEAFMPATDELREEFDRAFVLELDRVEGIVGIDLGALSERRDSTWKADEVRKLLWRGFAGKMLSQGYDPEDVLQEVYCGLLVRNAGRCPWDGRKSTFGHYVHMVISCVTTNYHRKQLRRIDKDAVPVDVRRDGEELGDIGQWGSCLIEHGSELGDRLALEGLARWLEGVPCDVPEAALGREILPRVVAGQQRSEIVAATGERPSLVSQALAWLRRQAAEWACSGGLAGSVPAKYRTA
jgi:DNA-directed RNA polymerase specialized sigma24 family protein